MDKWTDDGWMDRWTDSVTILTSLMKKGLMYKWIVGFIWMTMDTHPPSLPIIIITVLSYECILGMKHRMSCYNNNTATINLGLLCVQSTFTGQCHFIFIVTL